MGLRAGIAEARLQRHSQNANVFNGRRSPDWAVSLCVREVALAHQVTRSANARI